MCWFVIFSKSEKKKFCVHWYRKGMLHAYIDLYVHRLFLENGQLGGGGIEAVGIGFTHSVLPLPLSG